MKRTFFLLLTITFTIVACKHNKNPNESDEPRWGNIGVDTAEILIKTFCKYSDDTLKDYNSTKSVWFNKKDLEASFAPIFEKEKPLKEDEYDGYRIYLARYPEDWKPEQKSNANTLVIVRTKYIEDGYHEDLIESGMQTLRALNDGGRCLPNCNGTKLLEEEYRSMRTKP